jgi:ADP-ribose pyrophosphatase YjhB (NUDIX family)
MGELDGWRHCPRCTSPLVHEEPSVRCGSCGLVVYAKPSPAVCALVVDDAGRVLLGRRAREPAAGLWDILGGFVEEDEDPIEALRRELHEETGLVIELLGWVGAVADRYGEGGPATLNLCWTARIAGGELRRDDELAELRWFGRDELPLDEFAFPNCVELLRAWRDGFPHSGRK